MKKLACLLLLSRVANADFLVDGGLGVFNSGKHTLSETKMLTLGVQQDLYGSLKDRAVVGGWLDNDAGEGKANSGVIAGQVGFEVNRAGTIGSVFFGPSFITNPDALLGSHFEFMVDFHLGIQDTSANYIGAYYRHLSDAGLTHTNVGRDIFGLELRF